METMTISQTDDRALWRALSNSQEGTLAFDAMLKYAPNPPSIDIFMRTMDNNATLQAEIAKLKDDVSCFL